MNPRRDGPTTQADEAVRGLSSGERGPFGISRDRSLPAGASMEDTVGVTVEDTVGVVAAGIASAMGRDCTGREVEAGTGGMEIEREAKAGIRVETVLAGIAGVLRGTEDVTEVEARGKYKSSSEELLLSWFSKSIVIHESYRSVSPITDHSLDLVGVWGTHLPGSGKK